MADCFIREFQIIVISLVVQLITIQEMKSLSIFIPRSDLGGALGAEAPPPKTYHEQASKLLEAVVQVQLPSIHNKNLKRTRGIANFILRILIIIR